MHYRSFDVPLWIWFIGTILCFFSFCALIFINLTSNIFQFPTESMLDSIRYEYGHPWCRKRMKHLNCIAFDSYRQPNNIMRKYRRKSGRYLFSHSIVCLYILSHRYLFVMQKMTRDHDNKKKTSGFAAVWRNMTVADLARSTNKTLGRTGIYSSQFNWPMRKSNLRDLQIISKRSCCMSLASSTLIPTPNWTIRKSLKTLLANAAWKRSTFRRRKSRNMLRLT